MDKRPKRRKNKDNPYVLEKEDDTYFVTFIDNQDRLHRIEIGIEVFDAFDRFELDDLSQMNKDDLHKDYRYIDNTEESEIILYQHSINYAKPLDVIVEDKIRSDELKKIIDELPIVQKDRLKKYYFDNKTFEEIAKEEHCTKMAVKFSVDLALEKISKKFKN